MIIVYRGKDSLKKIEEILNHEKPNSILLVRGNKSYDEGGAKELIEPQLNNYNIIHLSGFHKSSNLEDVEKATDIIRKKNIDFIIGIGGGTVMDVAKASSVLHNKNSLKKYIVKKKKVENKAIKKLLIPTTAGTGAEITPFSVIYINKTKYSFQHPNVLADYVILAPKLTYNLNRKVTAETGCDALAQAVESFWSVNATKESKKYSKKAISLILNNLKEAVNNPCPKNRKAMLEGAYLAGRAIAIARTTAAHALSYPLTAHHNIPHGHAVMLTLPYFFPVNANVNKENIQKGLDLKYVKSTFKELLRNLNVKNGEEAQKKLLDLMDEIHLERKLSRLHVGKKDLGRIVAEGFNPQRVINNPVKITEEIEQDILRKII